MLCERDKRAPIRVPSFVAPAAGLKAFCKVKYTATPARILSLSRVILQAVTPQLGQVLNRALFVLPSSPALEAILLSLLDDIEVLIFNLLILSRACSDAVAKDYEAWSTRNEQGSTHGSPCLCLRNSIYSHPMARRG